MSPSPLLAILAHLGAAADALDAGYDATPQPWSGAAESFVDDAAEHASDALDSAVFAALRSGLTIADVEAAIGRPFEQPDWFTQ